MGRAAVDIRRTVARALTLFCTLCVLALLPASSVSGAEEGHVQIQRNRLLGRRERRHVQRDRPALGQHKRRGVDPVLGQRDRDRDGWRRELLVHGRHPQLRCRPDHEDLPGHDRRQRHRERAEQDDRVQALQCDSARLSDQDDDGHAHDHRQRGTGHARLQHERLHRRRRREPCDHHGEPPRRLEPAAQRRLRDPAVAHQPRRRRSSTTRRSPRRRRSRSTRASSRRPSRSRSPTTRLRRAPRTYGSRSPIRRTCRAAPRRRSARTGRRS